MDGGRQWFTCSRVVSAKRDIAEKRLRHRYSAFHFRCSPIIYTKPVKHPNVAFEGPLWLHKASRNVGPRGIRREGRFIRSLLHEKFSSLLGPFQQACRNPTRNLEASQRMRTNEVRSNACRSNQRRNFRLKASRLLSKPLLSSPTLRKLKRKLRFRHRSLRAD